MFVWFEKHFCNYFKVFKSEILKIENGNLLLNIFISKNDSL